MAQVKLETKLKAFRIHITARILRALDKRGAESEFSSDKVVKIKNEDHMFNLEGGRYLTEINTEHLIDNLGYQYSHETLDLRQLCEVVDGL